MCTLVLMMELHVYIWQGLTVASIQKDIDRFVGLLFIKFSPCAPDSFLNPQCCNQCPNTVLYYGGSCKNSSGPLFQSRFMVKNFSIFIFMVIVSYRLFDYSRVLYLPHRTLSAFEIGDFSLLVATRILEWCYRDCIYPMVSGYSETLNTGLSNHIGAVPSLIQWLISTSRIVNWLISTTGIG